MAFLNIRCLSVRNKISMAFRGPEDTGALTTSSKGGAMTYAGGD